MNYQTIKVNGQILYIDTDCHRTKCKKCGDLIIFGINSKSNNKSLPIEKIEGGYRLHSCKIMSDNYDIEKEQSKNQDYLNNL